MEERAENKEKTDLKLKINEGTILMRLEDLKLPMEMSRSISLNDAHYFNKGIDKAIEVVKELYETIEWLRNNINQLPLN